LQSPQWPANTLSPVGFATRGLHGGHDGQFDQRRSGTDGNDVETPSADGDQRRTNERIAAVAMTACGSSVRPSPRRRSRSLQPALLLKSVGALGPAAECPSRCSGQGAPQVRSKRLAGSDSKSLGFIPDPPQKVSSRPAATVCRAWGWNARVQAGKQRQKHGKARRLLRFSLR
jgi:hypothetical protein